MGQYHATITYFRPRHFGRSPDGNVTPSGELLRLGETTFVGYIRSEEVMDARKDVAFAGQILFVSQTEQRRPFEPGTELEIVAPGPEPMQVIGRCILHNKAS